MFAIFYGLEAHTQGDEITQRQELQDVELMGGHL